MAKKRKDEQKRDEVITYAPIEPQLITETIEKNYMPYAMSVIVSRAIPEIDGLKPAHRKLLYTMFKMGLLTGPRTKSANIVGQTMRLNPHGDASIYETMVRLTRGNASLLHPLVDSKGSFGKQYSSDMKYAASRYTEAKLDPFCAELFRGIDKNAVDFVPNYDGTMQEPLLLPTTFPNILVTPNTGIAVGMASNICSFNLAEICDGTIALLKKPRLTTEELMNHIKAPDFSGGGILVYDKEQMRQIYETGVGSFRLRSRYVYDKEQNCIDILQIPYSTTIEIILNKISELVKEGKLKEITDFRDEIDLSGFKLTLDLRRGVDPDALMQKLFKLTTLEDSFKCNFNILVDYVPRQMGLIEILSEWILFRTRCVRRELSFDLKKKEDKLHLLNALALILLDIDKAIAIIRGTEKEEDVVPNLMEGFGIDEIQADYIADIKLRNLNRQYILNRIMESEDLEAEIKQIKEILGDELKLKGLIAKQLGEIKKKYGMPRKTQLLDASEITAIPEIDTTENYNVHLYLTNEGYFKKITLRSLQGSDEQKYKDGDYLVAEAETDNLSNLMFFTDQRRVYRTQTRQFDCVKASLLGDYLPAKLEMDIPNGEKPVSMHVNPTYSENEYFVFIFENGKGVRVAASAYQTQGNRSKLTGAFSSASPIAAVLYETAPFDITLVSDAGKAITLSSSMIPIAATRTAGGVTLMSLKKGQRVLEAVPADAQIYEQSKGIRKLKIPATGVPMTENSLRKLKERFPG
jgi:DNA gyrase subunit A